MSNIRWRESYRTPRIVIFDARLGALLLAALMHWSRWTFGAAALAIGILYFFEVRRKMSLESAFRWMKCKLLGAYRRGHPSTRRWSVDYGRIGRDA